MKIMTETKPDGLKIALPNGSLEEGTLRLFKDANLEIRKSPRRHIARVDGGLIDVAKFVRPQIAPDLVANGTYHLGICGLDCVEESGAEVVVLAELPYGRGTSIGSAKVVLVASMDNSTRGIADVPAHSVVLSEYPNITRRAFAKFRIPVEIRFSYGSTEAHIPEDYTYGVCLTDTGDSLEANKLKVLSVLFESKTVLIANSVAMERFGNEITAVRHLLVGTLEARSYVFLTMNVSARKKAAVLKMLPALKQPTVTKLAGGQGYAIGTVVHRTEQNVVLMAVLRSGATDVLVQPILQMVRSWD